MKVNRINIHLENFATDKLEQVDKKYGKLRVYQSGKKTGGFISKLIDDVVNAIFSK